MKNNGSENLNCPVINFEKNVFQALNIYAMQTTYIDDLTKN